MCTDRRRARGFTFIELIFFIVVVGVGITGILSVLNVTAQRSADPVHPKQALAIAEALMEEIQAKDFADTDHPNDFAPSSPPGVAERQNFDNVMDFNNYGVVAVGPPAVLLAGIHDVLGNAVASLAGYRVRVEVAEAAAALNGVAVQIGGIRQMWVITVSVTDPSGTVHVFTGYRLNYG